MKISGSCHCKATRFEVAFAPESVTACTCSNCSKRGALWAYYEPKDVTFASRDADGLYQWGPKIGQYHFCKQCGNSTYNQTPTWVDYKPDFDHPRISVNARLFDDFDVGSLPVEVIDGKNLW